MNEKIEQLANQLGDEATKGPEDRLSKRIKILMEANPELSVEDAERQIKIEGTEGLRLAKEQKTKEYGLSQSQNENRE